MKNDLLDHGYNDYKPSVFDGDCVTRCYQKAFRDGDDRKYFLTWHEWDFSKYADHRHPELLDHTFEGETQLTTTDGDVINITFLSGWGREKAEKFMEKLFDTGWFKKYDHDYEEEQNA